MVDKVRLWWWFRKGPGQLLARIEQLERTQARRDKWFNERLMALESEKIGHGR